MLRAGTGADAVRLDGRLDEPAWLAGDSVELTQVEPVPGGASAGRTVVRVLASPSQIVIGVRADDPDPSAITAFARARDAGLGSEDHVRIVLDTYLDGRSGYVFVVNPHGARYDALVTNQGEGESADWDAIWDAATARTATGWSVEFAIPIKSLLFRPGAEAWGFNVQRRIQRFQETDRWASPSRDVKINVTSRAGLLTGLPLFELGFGLSVRPAFTAAGGWASRGTALDGDVDASLDVTQRLGGNTLASLTANTDFAETDVDTRRTNLTRFPLVFPEKRTFFLEGLDIFEFGLGTGDDVRTFFSRRIGLLASREVPLDLGLKVNGRAAGTSFGALAVRTGAFDSVPGSTMGVLRLRRDVLRQSSVGIIATAGDPLNRRGSVTGGADFTYQTSRLRGDKNFLMGVWGLATDRVGARGRTGAFGAKIDYPNDLWDVALTYKWIGDGFDPSLGFVPRPGAQITSFNVVYQPRPQRRVLGLRVRQMFNEWLNTLVTDLSGRWESYRVFTAPINWRLESGDRFEINVVRVGERLAATFPIDTVLIPAGEHHWWRYRLEAGLAAKRRISGQITWWFGTFYTGRLSELIVTATWRASPLTILEFNATRNRGRLPQGGFVQQVVGTRLRLNVSPDLTVASYVQYDNGTHQLGANSRLRWTFVPQGDLFIVYNHNVSEVLDPVGRRTDWRFGSSQLLAKVQYAFRY
jgi:hypothetical protein